MTPTPGEIAYAAWVRSPCWRSGRTWDALDARTQAIWDDNAVRVLEAYLHDVQAARRRTCCANGAFFPFVHLWLAGTRLPHPVTEEEHRDA